MASPVIVEIPVEDFNVINILFCLTFLMQFSSSYILH